MKKIIHQYGWLVLLILFHSAYGVEEHTKFWSVANILGSFSNNDRLKYYFEPQIRFIDNQYKFNQALMLAGLGYQNTFNVIWLGGIGWILTKNLQGEMRHENRLWQQINWNINTPVTVNLASRTRLEERKLTTEGQIAYRLRERFFLRIPLKSWSNHSLSFFDEVFFNLNQPGWVIQKFFEQNRAFVGIGTQLSKTTIMDVGYLNQYLATSPVQLDNVILISFTIVT